MYEDSVFLRFELETLTSHMHLAFSDISLKESDYSTHFNEIQEKAYM